MASGKSNVLPSRLRVAVVLSQELGCYRDILRGINAYAIQKRDWHLDVYWPNEDVASLLKSTKPNGLVIGPIEPSSELKALAKLAPRTVGVAIEPGRGIATVGSDDQAVGELAADYFVKKGFKHFAFLGVEIFWSKARQEGFLKGLEKLGHAADASLIQPFIQPSFGRGFSRPHYSQDILNWVQSLPKPLAVLAANDLRGREVLELLGDESIHVPDQLAVLGVDDDELECELARPPLSSVAVPWNRIGFEAGNLLDQLISGQTVASETILVSPSRVAERQSTDVVAVDDADVAAAIRFIREHAHRNIGVADVLRAVPTGRRSIERRFQQLLGRTPLDEIRRVRIDLAKQWLATSDQPIPAIALKCGFSSVPWFSTSFRDLTGETPASFRRKQQTNR